MTVATQPGFLPRAELDRLLDLLAGLIINRYFNHVDRPYLPLFPLAFSFFSATTLGARIFAVMLLRR